jgi:hypothetical protein
VSTDVKITIDTCRACGQDRTYAEVRTVEAKLGSSDSGLDLVPEVGQDAAIRHTSLVVGGAMLPDPRASNDALSKPN